MATSATASCSEGLVILDWKVDRLEDKLLGILENAWLRNWKVERGGLEE
jgi:hypothetical protein